ncbi:NUDIX hydrolase [Sedimenticola thiotaurini]|uniref:NUDIX hydrolase n=1 Tax=Sedimenticola thiotaurini TaxID=1543721 RepID=A0A0F7JZS0_9GAMM|nr:NUDIX domain-containing protein [Sedimenticola thiotaurini]AKH20450.1 NUDIX hydrolase [Sedimenticola thiotaurini]
MTFEYQYPHPAVTTDVAVFTLLDQQLQLLLIRRGEEPYKGHWALPGGFLEIDEDLDSCAKRELKEETGVDDLYLEQLYTFGRPDRDPRERVISVTYYALVPADKLNLSAGSDAAEASWFPLQALPDLAFDHAEIILLARERLAAKTHYSTIAFQLMPETFTLSELQTVYEILRNEKLDKRNFRKWVLSLQLLEETGGKRRNGNHRPAKIYRLTDPDRVHIIR